MIGHQRRLRVWSLDVQVLATDVAYLVVAGTSFAVSVVVSDRVLIRDFIEGVAFMGVLAAISAWFGGIGRATGLTPGADAEADPPALPDGALVVSARRAFLTVSVETLLFMTALFVPAYFVLGASVLAWGAGVTSMVIATSAPGVIAGSRRRRRSSRRILVEARFFRESKAYVREVAVH